MPRKTASLVLALSTVVMLSAGLLPASARPRTVVVIPARYRVVGLLQDACRLRAITLVAYQGDASTANPTLHTWQNRQWTKVSIDEFRNPPDAGSVVLVGDDQMLPGVLVEAIKNVPTIRRVDSLDAAKVTLALAQILKLSESELLWLARRNELTVKDLNAELRRYGKYGRPSKKESSHPTTKAPSTPAPVPEEPQLEPVPEDMPMD